MNADTITRDIRFTVTGTGWKIAKEYLANQEKKLVFYKMPINQQQNYVIAGSLKNLLAQKIDSDLRITEIFTDTFFVNNNRNVRKLVKIVVDKDKVALAEGFRISGPIKVSPQQIFFEGSVEKINQLPDSIAVSIKEIGIRKSFDKLVSLSYLERPNLKAQQSVKVTFDVEEFLSKKVKFNIEKINFPEGYELPMEQAEIMCVFKAQMETNIDLTDFKVVADYSKFHIEDSTVTLQLERIPQGIEDAKVINPHTKIKIPKK
jgi:YbbR domain-containing protein